jgi:hypothetical protein
VAYTVSTYSSASGPRKNLVTVNLHIHSCVVLHEPIIEAKGDVSGDDDGANK